jgi:hypothetical protein
MAKKKQKGIAMLMIVIALALTISVYYFSTVSLVDIKNDNTLNTQAELKRAKQALLDYALINWRRAGDGGKIGKLPCPDHIANAIDEGLQEGNCGTAYDNKIGFFPWRTLGIDTPKDSSASCLLYVVSPAYKLNPVAALNPDSYGQIQIVDSVGGVIQGASPEDRPVAVIIAPGEALAGQARVFDEDSICGLDYANISAYLDDDGTTDNAAIAAAANNVIDVLVNSYAGSDDWDNPNPLNDRLITITHEEFWDALDSTITDAAFDTRMDNLTEAIAMCLAAYGSNNGDHLPMPAALDLNSNDYRNDFSYDDSGVFTSGFSGRLPYDISNANLALPAPVVPPNDDNLFSNTVCDDIDLVTGVFNNINFKDDSGDDNGEFFDLWRNWKDHFFYAIAEAHKPDAVVAPCAANCIRVNGADYAGIVFFSGLKQAGQQRYAPPFDSALAADGIDDKDDVVNYLENGNAVLFPDNVGNQVYSPAPFPAAPPSNDIMFCITPAMTVNRC